MYALIEYKTPLWSALVYVIGCAVKGEGYSGINGDRTCSKCLVNTTNNNAGSRCIPCKKGYDTDGMTGATQCGSKCLHLRQIWHYEIK